MTIYGKVLDILRNIQSLDTLDTQSGNIHDILGTIPDIIDTTFSILNILGTLLFSLT